VTYVTSPPSPPTTLVDPSGGVATGPPIDLVSSDASVTIAASLTDPGKVDLTAIPPPADLTKVGTPAVAPATGTFAFGTRADVPAGAKALIPEWASVQDFGAAGDGVTVDTAAINAAITYAKAHGVALYIPAGTYLTAGSHDISGLTVFGAGAQASVFTVSGAQGFVIQSPETTLAAVGITGPASAPLAGFIAVSITEAAPRCLIRDCDFATYGGGPTANNCAAVQFQYVTAGSLNYSQVVGCRFKGAYSSGTGYAIWIADGFDDITIAHCVFGMGTPSGGIVGGHASTGTAGIVVTGCLFTEDTSSVCIGAGGEWVITGNVFESVSVAVDPTSLSAVVITGNSFQLWDASSLGDACLNLLSVLSATVTGNAFHLPTGTGPPILASTTAAIVITGNSFVTGALPTQANLAGAQVVRANGGVAFGWDTTAPVLEDELTVTTLTNVLTYTPAQAGLFQVSVYYRVVTATTTVTVQVTSTDVTGAQTTVLVNAVARAVGSYAVASLPLYGAAGDAITVQAQAGTANQVFVSAALSAV